MALSKVVNNLIESVDAAKLTGSLPSSMATNTLKLEYNQAILAFKIASSNQLSQFKMVDQVIDEYQDATGIDAGNSTNELASGSGTAKYYAGAVQVGATVTHDADTTGTDGDYTWYQWNDTASTGSYSTNSAQVYEFLVVAGGGGGSGDGNTTGGAGGGAGGLRSSYGSVSGGGASAQTDLSFGAGVTYTMTVGAGGTGSTSMTNNGSNGGASSISGSDITDVTTVGGGKGAYTQSNIGAVGGSGGGNNYSTSTPAAGTTGEGYSGGTASTSAPYGGGAGGGTSGVGGSGSTATGGNGGAGLTIDITGSSVGYAGGGAGGTTSNTQTNGTVSGGGGLAGPAGTTSNGSNGTANSGGGGGAGSLAHNSGSISSNGGNGGSGVVIIRRQTYTSTTVDDLTLQSVATTAESAPTTADLVVLIEDGAGTATVNTDIKGYISRDGSAFSSAVTFVDEGDWGTNKRILVARNVDISGIASGTSMKYKLTTHNQSASSKETYIHATSLAWA